MINIIKRQPMNNTGPDLGQVLTEWYIQIGTKLKNNYQKHKRHKVQILRLPTMLITLFLNFRKRAYHLLYV